MKTPHKHAALIHAWADGAEIEMELSDGSWESVSPTCGESINYRIKPQMCKINRFEYPAPEMVAPKYGMTYFVPDGTHRHLHRVYTWDSILLDLIRLKLGLVHLTKQNAIAHARAQILAGGGVL